MSQGNVVLVLRAYPAPDVDLAALVRDDAKLGGLARGGCPVLRN
jgi:hypothetical protein